MNRGFTVIELVVSIGIFAVITAFVVAKFGNFNQSALLTDTAYDIALAIHTAQNYGLSVRNVYGSSNNFGYPYGIDFRTSTGVGNCGSKPADSTHLVLYADSNPLAGADGICGSTDTSITSYAITRGAAVAPTASSGLCVGNGSACTSNATQLDISYTRPNPEAKICASVSGSTACSYNYAEVSILGTDGSTRTVSIRQNGQVSVKPY
jgi:prepilin-type N-terminal cleavage/methylation domain-containing protein